MTKKVRLVKKTTVTPKAVSTAKNISKKQETILDEANEASIVKKATNNRVLKYNYPDHISGPLERKAWRATVRAAIRKFENAISKLSGKELTQMKKDFKAYQAEVLEA